MTTPKRRSITRTRMRMRVRPVYCMGSVVVCRLDRCSRLLRLWIVQMDHHWICILSKLMVDNQRKWNKPFVGFVYTKLDSTKPKITIFAFWRCLNIIQNSIDSEWPVLTEEEEKTRRETVNGTVHYILLVVTLSIKKSCWFVGFHIHPSIGRISSDRDLLAFFWWDVTGASIALSFYSVLDCRISIHHHHCTNNNNTNIKTGGHFEPKKKKAVGAPKKWNWLCDCKGKSTLLYVKFQNLGHTPQRVGAIW